MSGFTSTICSKDDMIMCKFSFNPLEGFRASKLNFLTSKNELPSRPEIRHLRLYSNFIHSKCVEQNCFRPKHMLFWSHFSAVQIWFYIKSKAITYILRSAHFTMHESQRKYFESLQSILICGLHIEYLTLHNPKYTQSFSALAQAGSLTILKWINQFI